MARSFISKEHFKASEAALQELQKEITNTIESYKSDILALPELLAFQSRFYRYSARNTTAIFRQNPHATFVTSYKRWQDMGYQVLKGQRGLKVLLLVDATYFKENGQLHRLYNATPEQKRLIENHQLETITVKHPKIGTVFDISQTDCPAADYPRVYNMGYSSENHAQLYELLKGYALENQFTVQEKDLSSIELRGQYVPSREAIHINHLLQDTQKLSTLTHELGHGLLHTSKNDLYAAEFEADVFSILTHGRFGIEIPHTRLAHLQENFALAKESPTFNMLDSLDKAGRAFKALCESIDPIMEQRLHPEQTQQHTQQHSQGISL